VTNQWVVCAYILGVKQRCINNGGIGDCVIIWGMGPVQSALPGIDFYVEITQLFATTFSCLHDKTHCISRRDRKYFTLSSQVKVWKVYIR